MKLGMESGSHTLGESGGHALTHFCLQSTEDIQSSSLLLGLSLESSPHLGLWESRGRGQDTCTRAWAPNLSKIVNKRQKERKKERENERTVLGVSTEKLFI